MAARWGRACLKIPASDAGPQVFRECERSAGARDALRVGLTTRSRARVRERGARRTRSSRDVLAVVERALRVQALEELLRRCRPTQVCRDGPGENRGRGRLGNGRCAVQGRVAQHPSAVEPFQGRRRASAASCATSSRSARARSRCSTLRFGSVRNTRSLSPRRSRAGIGIRQLIGVPTIGASLLRGSVRAECLINAMALGLASVRSWCAARRRIREHARAFGARTGRKDRGRRCSPRRAGEATRARTSARPCRSATRSEKEALECSLEFWTG